MALALVPLNIASICVESVFYGIFCALFSLSLYFLVKCTGGRRSFPKPMLIFSVLIFLVVTAHWSLSAVRTFQAFFLHHGGQNPEAFFSDISQFSAVFSEGTRLGLLIIGDLAIVYRLWAVWGHHRGVMIIPVILLIGLAALVVLNLREYFKPNTNLLQNPEQLQANASVLVNALSATTFSINVYSTGMIAFKLHKAGRATRDNQFTFIIIILVESLSLHRIWGVFFLICYWLGSFLCILISEAQCSVTGIAFMVLHVRVGLRRLSNTSMSVESRDLTEGCSLACDEG